MLERWIAPANGVSTARTAASIDGSCGRMIASKGESTDAGAVWLSWSEKGMDAIGAEGDGDAAQARITHGTSGVHLSSSGS